MYKTFPKSFVGYFADNPEEDDTLPFRWGLDVEGKEAAKQHTPQAGGSLEFCPSHTQSISNPCLSTSVMTLGFEGGLKTNPEPS